MAQAESAPLPGRWVRLWWTGIPLAARRVSASLTVALADGLYVAVRPVAAFLAPPLILLAGFAFGWKHPGIEQVFSESLLLLCVAAGIGVMSGNLGAHFLVGFIVGDFFLAHASWSHPGGLLEHVARVRVPLLIQYSLLGMLTVGIPLFTKALLVQLTPPAALGRPLRFVVALVGHVALTGTLVFFWARAVPILVRPVFTWQPVAPTPQAMAPLQEHGLWVVAVAVAASMLRMGLQGWTVFHPGPDARLAALQEHLTSARPVTPLVERLPRWLRVLLRSVWGTVMLAGIYASALDAVLLGGLIFATQAARAGWFRLPLGGWPALIERVPLLFRLIACSVILYLLTRAFLGEVLMRAETFRPMVVLTAISMVLVYLLIPGTRAERRSGEPPR